MLTNESRAPHSGLLPLSVHWHCTLAVHSSPLNKIKLEIKVAKIYYRHYEQFFLPLHNYIHAHPSKLILKILWILGACSQARVDNLHIPVSLRVYQASISSSVYVQLAKCTSVHYSCWVLYRHEYKQTISCVSIIILWHLLQRSTLIYEGIRT